MNLEGSKPEKWELKKAIADTQKYEIPLSFEKHIDCSQCQIEKKTVHLSNQTCPCLACPHCIIKTE